MNARKNKNINRGAAFFSIVFVLLFFVLIARFGYIEVTQSVQGKSLTNMAKDRWMSLQRLEAERGTIYDRKGQPLAEDVPAYNVYAVLSETTEHVKNIEKTAGALAPILDMKESRIRELLSRDAFQVELGPGGRRISYEKMMKIKKLDLPGIGFLPTSKRYYPNQEFASYVVGFTTRDPETELLRGVMGVEKSMNSKLQGKGGYLKSMTAPGGTTIPGSEKEVKPPKDGANVYLTIDSHIQTFLETALSKAEEQYHPKRMMGVVIDPNTGKILAMANRPTFNPNTRKLSDYTNDIISSRFEPGSVMKIFTLAAAVDAGVYDGDATYQSGVIHYGPSTIHDWNYRGWGEITFNEAVRRSSNVGFAILAQDYIGFDRLYDYLMKFDFKQRTGIALPNEGNSHFQYDVPVEKATTAFGQGTAVTAIQMVKAATAIANDGKMMKPYMIDKVVDPNSNEVVIDHEPKVVGRPISERSAKKVRDLLRTVVSGEHGTGRDFAIEGYEVAGKTGTAQIPNENGVGYMSGKYIHSFMGMAPMDDPQLLVYVAVDRPEVKTMFAGEKPVADIFKFVMKNSLQYLNVQPEETDDTNETKSSSVAIGDYEGKPVTAAKQELQDKGLQVVVLGGGDKVKAQMPFSGEQVLPGAKVLLKTEGTSKMPNIIGWSLADVMKLAHLLQLDPEIKGAGFVTGQSIPPGRKVKQGDAVTVELQAPKPVEAADSGRSGEDDKS
ncbi:MAG TPA: penicillin-binding transpeptidase domain-containing protein [Bacillales bacterium]|nr:penicillin-binding transpeptidase domain-containing protein [Bacillales bacterium]